MHLRQSPTRSAPLAACCAAALYVAAGLAEAREPVEQPPLNLRTGEPLRHGVYGRIAVRGATPPPLVSAVPVVARRGIGPVQAKPAYLYVPAGHVRKWRRHCGKWNACAEPVFFVRMDGAPGRWGTWSALRELEAAAARDH